MKKISVITVNFNNAKGLEKTIDSVLSQTYKDLEYIVVDGASTDGSKDIINQHHADFHWYCSEPDRGIYDAMNKGINHATGEYLLFLNSGDYFINKKSLEKLIAQNMNADLVICRQKFISAKGKITSSPKLRDNEIDMKYFLSSTFPHQSTLIRHELFTKIGLYDISYKVSADWVFWVRAIIEYKCSFKLSSLFITYMEDGGVSRDMTKCHADMSKLLDSYKEQGLIDWNDIFDIAIKARSKTYCERYYITTFVFKICAWIGKHF